MSFNFSRGGFCIALVLSLAACKETLHRDLTEREANEIFSVLDISGISTSRKYNTANGTYDVLVDKDHISRAVNVLAARNLPRENFMTMGEVFSGDGFVSTPFEEKARYIFALNQELAQSLTFIEGVAQARVHLVLPEPNRITQQTEDAGASVFIFYHSGFDLQTAIAQIKTAIASSVDGLSYENVSIAAFAQPTFDTDAAILTVAQK